MFYFIACSFILIQRNDPKSNPLMDNKADVSIRSGVLACAVCLSILKQNGQTIIKSGVHYWPTDSILCLVCQHGALETSGD